MAGMLYYPTLNPPTPVLYQALLYWDRLATIVPAGYERYLDGRVRQVRDAGLYQPVSAAEVASDPEIRCRARAAIANLVLTHAADDLIPRRLRAYELLRQPREEWARRAVASSKLNHRVVEDLLRRRLAELDPDLPEVLWVSPIVQMCVLGVTAREVARRVWEREGCTSEAALFPHTDQPRAHRAAHGGDRVPCWTVEIGGLLPVPRDDVLIADVIAFRRRYDDERRRLVLAIDQLIHGLARQYDHPRDVFLGVERELQTALADLEAAGRSVRLRWVRRSVSATVALAGGYAGARYHSDAGWLLGLIGAVAVNVATGSVSHYGKATVDVSYLHRMGQVISPP